jgi:hypothetical protein
LTQASPHASSRISFSLVHFGGFIFFAKNNNDGCASGSLTVDGEKEK